MPQQILITISQAWKLILRREVALSKVATGGFCILMFLMLLTPFIRHEYNDTVAWFLIVVRVVFLWTLYGMLNLEMGRRIAMANRIGRIGRSLTVSSDQAEVIAIGIKEKSLSCEDAIRKLTELTQSLKMLAADL